MLPLPDIVLPYLLVLATPGPNLLLVLRASMAPVARPAIETSLGIAMGAGLAAFCAGFVTIGLPQGQVVETAARILVALLLFRIGLRTLRAGNTSVTTAGTEPTGRYFCNAVLTALCNPVSISFFAGIFLGHLPDRGSLAWLPACLTIMVVAASWFLLLSTILRHPRFRRAFQFSEQYLRVVIGSALFVFAGSMIVPLLW